MIKLFIRAEIQDRFIGKALEALNFQLFYTYRAIAGEAELTLRVGAQRDGGYYATVNDDDTIYLLPAAPAEALAALAANGLNG